MSDRIDLPAYVGAVTERMHLMHTHITQPRGTILDRVEDPHRLTVGDGDHHVVTTFEKVEHHRRVIGSLPRDLHDRESAVATGIPRLAEFVHLVDERLG